MAKLKPKGRYIVGAYATSPNLFSWDEKTELNYFNRLKELTSIRGLEIPFWGKNLHAFDDSWFLSNLEPSWQNVLTCVPGTMKSLEKDPYFGLASKNKKSRNNAIQFYSNALRCVKQLKSAFGDESVKAILITSAPIINDKQVYANKENFILSLIELASWDWGKTKLVIEHCDAYSNINYNPQKGFLPLIDEIDSILKVNLKHSSNYGIAINWARSVIEFKDIEGPLKHLKNTVHHNVLDGLMFSGTTDNDNNLYGAWSDLHMPPCNHLDFKFFESESLMSYNSIKQTLMACDYDKLNFLGIKLLAMPSNSSIEKRISINSDALILLDQAINEIPEV